MQREANHLQSCTTKFKSPKLIKGSSQKKISDDEADEPSLGLIFERLPNDMGWMRVNSFRACKHCRQSHIKCSLVETGGPCTNCRNRQGPCELRERCDKRDVPYWIFPHESEQFQIYKTVFPSPSRKARTPIEPIIDSENEHWARPVDGELLKQKLQWLINAPSRFRKRSSPMAWKEAEDSNIEQRIESFGENNLQKLPDQRATNFPERLCFQEGSSSQLPNASKLSFESLGSPQPPPAAPQKKKRKSQVARAGNRPPKQRKNSISRNIVRSEDSLSAHSEYGTTLPAETVKNLPQKKSHPIPGKLLGSSESPNTQDSSYFFPPGRMSLSFIVAPSPPKTSCGTKNSDEIFNDRLENWDPTMNVAADSLSNFSARSGTRSPSLEPSEATESGDNVLLTPHSWGAPPNNEGLCAEKSVYSNSKTFQVQLPSLKQLFADQVCILSPINCPL